MLHVTQCLLTADSEERDLDAHQVHASWFLPPCGFGGRPPSSDPVWALFSFFSYLFFSRFFVFFLAFYFFHIFSHFFSFLFFFFFFFLFSIFFFHFFLKKKVSSLLFLYFFQIFFIAGVSIRVDCFLRSRCSMEMWCPDDIGRDSWDWVGPPAWGRACFNSPEWGGGSSPVRTEPPQIVSLMF